MEIAIDHSDKAKYYNDILIQEGVILPCVSKIFGSFIIIFDLLKEQKAMKFSEDDDFEIS